MEDVAARAGVSRALVSIVFRDEPGASDETRQRVRESARAIGYRLDHRARLLSRKRTRLLGVTFGVEHEFHSGLLADLYAAAEQQGYELVLSGITAGRTENQAVQELLSLRCDALILLGPTLAARDLAAIAASTPTIAVARAVSATDVDVIRTDDVVGARMATEHLLDLGHRRIVHIDGGNAPGAAERRRGYRTAMRAADLDASVVTGGLTEEAGVDAARRQLENDGEAPTAAFVFNDASATGFLHEVRRVGKSVPTEFSVVGYDNSRLARAAWAQLTTVAQNIPALTRSAVERAVARLDGAPAGGPLLVAPRLVVRSTTSAVPAG
jgi:DNA-binding LacI/PurR family transcriptional regulator